MTAVEIGDKPLKILFEKLWEHGNDDYIKELSSSHDFRTDINYVIITMNEYSNHGGDIRKESLIPRVFNTTEFMDISEMISHEILNSLDSLLPPDFGLKLVNFLNYRSDNIVEELFNDRVLNSQHPFVQLIIDNRELFQTNDDYKLYLDYFWKTFGSIRHGHKLEHAVEYQRKLVNLIQEHGNIGNYDIEKNVLTLEDFPADMGFEKDPIDGD